MTKLGMNALISALIFCFSIYPSTEYFIGINGGLISSTIANTDPDILSRQAFAGYGSISIKPNSFLLLQFQLGYAMKGFQYKLQWNEEDSSGNQTSIIHNDKFVYKLDYI